MKIVPPSTLGDACTRVMDIESESKTSKARRHGSASESSKESEEESKTIQGLRKDLRQLIEEVAGSKKEKKEGRELWCTDCEKEGHTKRACPKKAFCEICQVLGHAIKDCPYNLKTRSAQVFLTQGEQSTPPSTPPKNTNMEVSQGGYRNNKRGSNNNSNNNTPRHPIQYDPRGGL